MAYNFNDFKKQLSGTEEWLKKELQQIRTGQASPAVLDGIRVEAYGTPMALKEVASVMIEGARSLRIAPYDLSQSKEIEKAITVANLGLSVSADDQGLRVNFPELTADRRKEIAKLAKDKMEDARSQIRRHRDAVVKDLDAKEKEGGMGKDEIFRLKKDVQKIVDDMNKKMEEIYAKKEKELLG